MLGVRDDIEEKLNKGGTVRCHKEQVVKRQLLKRLINEINHSLLIVSDEIDLGKKAGPMKGQSALVALHRLAVVPPIV